MELFITWFKMGLFTFGGGYAMLPLIQEEIVNKKQWATEKEILNYYTIGQVIPGIIAVNTATLVGYKKQGVFGAIYATLGIVLPSIIVISFMAMGLSHFIEYPVVKHILNGIKIGVSILLIISIYTMFKKSIGDIYQLFILLISLLLLIFTKFNIVIILLFALVIGLIINFTKINSKSGEDI
ncbi:MAG: chromate transporter [Anaerorhabdus sp.]